MSDWPAAQSIHECPKCGWPGPTMQYGPTRGMRRSYANGWECDPFCKAWSSKTEHLHVRCPDCGYEQVESVGTSGTP